MVGIALWPGGVKDASALARIRHAARAGAMPGLAPHAFPCSHAAPALFRRHGFAVTARRDGAANDQREPDRRPAWPAASPDLTRGANA